MRRVGGQAGRRLDGRAEQPEEQQFLDEGGFAG
jgi:hypothetical protein